MTKKILCIFSSLLLLSQLLQAKIPSSIENRMRVEDVLVVQEIQTGNLWNLTDADLSGKSYVAVYYNNGSDTIVRIVGNTQYYYVRHLNPTILLETGSEKNKIRDNLPELIMRYPLYNDEVLSGIYDSYGLSSDQCRIKTTGKYKTKISGISTLLLPNGDSLHNVMCVNAERQYVFSPINKKICKYNSGGRIIEEKEIETPPHSPIFICESIELLYAPEYRYPVVERIRMSDKHDIDKIYQSITLFCSPEIQSVQTNDWENERSRSFSSDVSTPQSAGLSWTAECEDICKYFNNDVDNKNIDFSIFPENPITGRLILADVSGTIRKIYHIHGDANTMTNISIDYSSLTKQPCVLYVSINKKNYQYSFFAK